MTRALIASTLLVLLGLPTISFTPRTATISITPITVKAQQAPGCLNECAPAAQMAFQSCLMDPEATLEFCQRLACETFISCSTSRPEGSECREPPGSADPAGHVPFCSSRD